MKRTHLFAAGLLLVLFAGLGLVQGGRVAWSQWLYYTARYGEPPMPIERILDQCRTALRLYPQHVRFCEFAAEEAYEASFAEGISNRVDLLAASRLWCDRGLALNPKSTYLRWLKTQFLWPEDRDAAIANWADYTDWDFWNAYNHAQLCEMLARAGRIEEAERELKWIEGSVYYPDVQATVMRARQERAPADSSSPGVN